MAIVVHKPVILPVSSLRQIDDNPKKPVGGKQLSGLRESIREFGFSAVLNVALDQDGKYTILDGNTRIDDLLAADVKEISCVIHDDMAHTHPGYLARRRQFLLSFDRHRKVYDETKVLAELQDQVAKGADIQKLAVLSGVDKLKRIIEESHSGTDSSNPEAKGKAQESAKQQAEKMPDMGTLMLYGPVPEIERIKEFIKGIKGRMSATQKVVTALEQANASLEMDDEGFLACFLSALALFQDLTLGGMDEEVQTVDLTEEGSKSP